MLGYVKSEINDKLCRADCGPDENVVYNEATQTCECNENWIPWLNVDDDTYLFCRLDCAILEIFGLIDNVNDRYACVCVETYYDL